MRVGSLWRTESRPDTIGPTGARGAVPTRGAVIGTPTGGQGVVAVAGEALVDLVPAPVPEYFEARPGGSPANVAVGLAHVGGDGAAHRET